MAQRDNGGVDRNHLIPVLSLARQGVAQPQVMVTGRSAPVAPPPWRPPAAGLLEEWTGTDMDPSVVSDRELHRWYSDASYGKDGEQHRQYVANAEKLLDVPLIPWKKAAEVSGFTRVPGYAPGQDFTLRQYLALAPHIAEWGALQRAIQSPKGSEEQKLALAQAEEIRAINDQYAGADLSDPNAHPIVAQAWGQLTGRNPRWDSPTGKEVASNILGAIKSGVTGGAHEDDPSISQEDFAKLQQQHGDDAHRMLTEGGLKNARREAAFDFLSALQDSPGLNPHVDSVSTAMTVALNNVPGVRASEAGGAIGGWLAGLGPQGKPPVAARADALTDPSAYRGRMAIANDRLSGAMQSFAAYDADPSRPYMVPPGGFSRLDPQSYMGLLNLMGSSSWGYGRNIGNPFKPVFGELFTRSYLKDNFADQKPLAFFQDVLGRTQREAPIRLAGESYEDSRGTRNFVADRKAAAHDYLSSHIRPLIADLYNGYRRDLYPHMTHKISRNPTQAEAVAYGLPQAIAESPIQIGLFAPGLAAKPLSALTVGLAKEGIEENLEDRIANPANTTPLFENRKQSAWMRPNPPGTLVTDEGGQVRRRTSQEYQQAFDADNVEAWQKGVEETNNNRAMDLEREYGRWLKLSPRASGR